jgi:glutaredoxin
MSIGVGASRFSLHHAPTRLRPAWVLLLLLGCAPEKPPAPEADATPRSAPRDDGGVAQVASWSPADAPAVLTYAAERGAFADTSDPTKVPEEARGLVRVKLLEGDSAPPGKVWVTNLRTPDAEGHYALSTVAREMFEELALGQGMSSQVQLPEGLEPPETVAAAGGVVVYKTAWCGVCKKLEAYLKRKGIEYEAKDIEEDPKAAAELRAKAQGKGINTSSVPVIDVGGELIVGFDRARLEKLLAG